MFAGRTPLFPVPFFEGCDPAGFVRGRPFRFTADFPWFLLVANAFDDQHFNTVHDRRLLEPATVDEPARFARRIRYRAEITGDSVFDRLLRPSVGRIVEISITSYGGSFVLVIGQFARTKSYIMICPQPHAADHIQVDVTVFAPRAGNPLLRGPLQWLGLEVRRLFTSGFMQDDIQRLPGIRYNRGGLVESDRQLIEYFQWASRLPGESHAMPTPLLPNRRPIRVHWFIPNPNCFHPKERRRAILRPIDRVDAACCLSAVGGRSRSYRGDC